EQLTDRPVIGILTVDYNGTYKKYHEGYSYLPASYAKFIESAGGRVVPILLKQTEQYYQDIFENTNGLLIPGGGTDLLTSEYAKAGKILWDLANAGNLRGDMYPIWGTCLGYELLTVLA